MPNEQDARAQIDKLLTLAGWDVQDYGRANIHAFAGVAIREFPLPGHGFADYLLYVDGKAPSVMEARKRGVTLTAIDSQALSYQSTGADIGWVVCASVASGVPMRSLLRSVGHSKGSYELTESALPEPF